MRIDYGNGYRIYFMKKKNEIIVLLIGGTKSTQIEDIEKAKKIAKEYEEKY
jgi:putative addiction module killer protein